MSHKCRNGAKRSVGTRADIRSSRVQKYHVHTGVGWMGLAFPYLIVIYLIFKRKYKNKIFPQNGGRPRIEIHVRPWEGISMSVSLKTINFLNLIF